VAVHSQAPDAAVVGAPVGVVANSGTVGEEVEAVGAGREDARRQWRAMACHRLLQ